MANPSRKAILIGFSLLVFTYAVTVAFGSQESSPTPPYNQTENSTDDEDTDRVFVIDCDPQGDANCNSPTLDQVARNLTAATSDNSNMSATINLTTDVLELTKSAEFSNLTSVTLRGRNSTINCTIEGIGIELHNIGFVLIENLAVLGCGSLLQIANTWQVRSALHISRCHHVTIRYVRIAHSKGSGLNLQRLTGNLLVTHSDFMDNFLTEDTTTRFKIRGGMGVLLYIASYHEQKYYEFKHCNFVRNVANSVKYDFILATSSSPSEKRGRGGGMLVTISRNTNLATVALSHCRFEGNQAFLGAGLSAEIEGGGSQNTLTVKDTEFIENGCGGSVDKSQSGSGIGGGAYLSFEGLTRQVSMNYLMNLTRVIFDSNCGELGGGTYFFSDRSSNVNKLHFNNCTWTKNYAHTGSAIDISPNFFVRTKKGYLPTPVFKDCKFLGNTIRPIESVHPKGHHEEDRQSYGSGTLYASLSDIEFNSFALFENNFGSAIIIVNGVADFENSNATFIHNRGIQGGALLLIGTASMVIGARYHYLFERNMADDRGGAIYSYLVDSTDFVVSRSCFIQYRDPGLKRKIIPSKNWSASLTFNNNSAQRGFGHSIYATSVIPCQVVNTVNGSSRYQILKKEEIFQPPGVKIINSQDRGMQIATDPNKFNYGNDSLLRVIPGEITDLGLKLLDDFGQEVVGTLAAYVRSSSSHNITMDAEFSCITDHTIKLNGQERDKGELVLQTISSRNILVTLNIELLPCPPAFQLDSNGACTCKSNNYIGIECKGNRAFLTQGFWTGHLHENQMQLTTSICPVGFCTYKEVTMGVVELPQNSSDLVDTICGTKRRGVLCGECREGYTTYYHSPNLECKEAEPLSCKLGWLFYILSELFPVTLIFLFVLALNINFTTGAVNGFILFSQLLDTLLIDASGVIKFPAPITALSRGYRIIYGFMNLDLFTTDQLAFCIWENATALDMLAFKFITVGYCLLLVLGVILFMKYHAARCFGRYYSITVLRNSVIHGLSGFLVLCYGQCIKISFSILYSNHLTVGSKAAGTDMGGGDSLNRVFFNGNLIHLRGKHLAYAIPAILILLCVGVLPPFILLGYPLLNRVFFTFKLENSWLVRCLNRASKLKPLLDSFQGSFKDQFRFFAGIYFFYRWTAVITYAIFSRMSVFYTILQVLLVAILVVHSMCQPYQKRWHNVLDTLLLGDLIVINGLTTLHYYWVRVDGNRDSKKIANKTTITGSIQLILIYLPFLYIVVYVIARLLGKTFCKAVKEEPSQEDFVLKKLGKRIYRSSTVGSEVDTSIDDSLPYRLVGENEENPFEKSVKANEDEDQVDTYG